jgi:hypothetical protein
MMKKKRRGPGRPPVNSILVGFKLSPAVAKGLRKRAKSTKRTLSAVAEEIFQAALQLDQKESAE